MRQNGSEESQMIFMVFREAGVSRLQETLIFNYALIFQRGKKRQQ